MTVHLFQNTRQQIQSCTLIPNPLIVVLFLLCNILGVSSPAGADTDITDEASQIVFPVASNSPVLVAGASEEVDSKSNDTNSKRDTDINIGFNYNDLQYPSCEGICTFAISRLRNSYSGKPSWEAVGGIVWQFDSPAKKQAEATLRQANAKAIQESDEYLVKISESLADAIVKKQREKAIALSMIVAKRLGYKDHQSLLRSFGVDW
jgi:hypothetical protein